MQVVVGSLLSVPVAGPDRYVAQVLRKKKGFILVAAFKAIGENNPIGPPELVALTFDSLVKAGEWTVVGQCDPDPEIPIPVFKMPISAENATYIQDIDGGIRRIATAEESSHLFAPVTYSAAAFQKAVSQVSSGGPLEARFAAMIPNWDYCEQKLV